MFWPIICGLIVLIFARREVFEDADGFLGYCGAIFLYVVFIVIGIGVGIVIAMGLSCTCDKQWQLEKTENLVSLRGAEGVSGTFFLGSGNIGATSYYFYYKTVTDSAGYRLDKVEADDDVTVFEEDQQGGELKTYTKELLNGSDWLVINPPDHRYEFFIPKGSIKRNYTLE